MVLSNRHIASVLLIPVLLLPVLTAPVVHAQEPDTVVVDTTAAPSDTVVTFRPVGFAGPEPGIVVNDLLPALHPALDAPGILTEMPGTFPYDFGTPGWPDVWSLYGLDPTRVALSLNGIPFNDPITGRPLYDLLPLAYMEPLRVQPTRYGAPTGVSGLFRPYSSRNPFTELRYRKGDSGLQSIDASHTQVRLVSLFGRQGVLGVVGGYSGRASQGEYPGSRLRRERKLFARLRYAGENWTVELLELFNRRDLGAHSGVMPRIPGVFESIYQRLDAGVFNQSALRHTSRNDLALTARRHLLPGVNRPFTATLFWTKYAVDFWSQGDTLAASARRVGGSALQEVAIGAHSMRLRVEGWTERLTQGFADPDSITASRREVHVTVHDTLRVFSADVTLEGGYHTGSAPSGFSGAIGVGRNIGRTRLSGTVTFTGQPVSWIERAGFGGYVEPVSEPPDGRVLSGRLGATFELGPYDLGIEGFASRTTNPIDFYAPAYTGGDLRSPDTVFVAVDGTPHERVGVTVTAGWRREVERGLYATSQATLLRFPGKGESELKARVASSIPQLFGMGRIGARFTLFQRDLDLDVYLQGRYWTEMRSRLFHPPTGLLVVPSLSHPVFGSSGTLDVVAEIGIRTATLFMAYENVLSGTVIMRGNLIVPVYPLPERRFRFGVYWPIFN